MRRRRASSTTVGLYQNNSGNVGIGTTAPLSTLSVAGNLAIGAYGGGSSTTAAPSNGLIVSGNVGIGVASPATALEIVGNNTAAGSLKIGTFEVQSYAANNSIIADNLFYNGAWKYVGNGYGTFMQMYQGGFWFYTAPSGSAGATATVTNALTILNSGYVGINQPTPTYNLDVNGTVPLTNLPSATGVGTVCMDSGYPISYIASNTCVPSDRRLKVRINPIGSTLNDIDRLRPVSFYWNKRSGNPDNRRRIGLIAQEVEQVMPEFVNTHSKGIKSVSYDMLTAPLIKAVQELKADNDNLRATVEKQGQEFEAYKAAHP